MREITMTIRASMGDLRALVRYPDDVDDLVPGLVLVDGAGEGTANGWGQRPAVLAGFGVVVLSHDKPGCGGSPGDWREQTLEDRAQETLAAVEALGRQPGVDPERIGLLGVSQGGWVSLIAASLAPEAIRHLVCVSGPGVSVIEQERYRLGCSVDDDPEAMAWVDERARRIIAGEDPDSIIADQQAYADRPWYAAATLAYGDPAFLRFGQRIIGFDPATVLPSVRCPVFAAFGGEDESVPVPASVARFLSLLPESPEHALAVFPGADHGLYITDDDTLPLADRLAPGFLPMLQAWLRAH
jgi:uncharacterized protein